MSTLWKKLTPQQLRFADYLIEGKNPAESYRSAYPNQSLSKNALAVEANRLKSNPKIQAYMDECLSERRSEVLLTRDQKRQILGSIAKKVSAPETARIAAIKADNEMTGDNAPVRIEGEITLFGIFKSLDLSTGLPTPAEVRALKPAVPTEPPKTREPAAPASTAMERAG